MEIIKTNSENPTQYFMFVKLNTALHIINFFVAPLTTTLIIKTMAGNIINILVNTEAIVYKNPDFYISKRHYEEMKNFLPIEFIEVKPDFTPIYYNINPIKL